MIDIKLKIEHQKTCLLSYSENKNPFKILRFIYYKYGFINWEIDFIAIQDDILRKKWKFAHTYWLFFDALKNDFSIIVGQYLCAIDQPSSDSIISPLVFGLMGRIDAVIEEYNCEYHITKDDNTLFVIFDYFSQQKTV